MRKTDVSRLYLVLFGFKKELRRIGILKIKGDIIKKLVLVLVVLVIAAGCGISLHTVKPVLPTLPTTQAVSSSCLYVKSYVVGTQKTAYIGQPMAWWQSAIRSETQDTEYASFLIEKDFKLSGTYRKNLLFASNVNITGFKGDECEIKGETIINGIKYYVITIRDNKDYGLLIDSNGMLNKNIVTDDNFDRVFSADKSNESILSPPDAHFMFILNKPKKKVKDHLYGIKRELIFGGVNNVSINVTYREYTPDDMARQAFYQNIIYQTSAEMIRFQDMKIKVHEVTNEKIIYTVLEDGLGMPTPCKE